MVMSVMYRPFRRAAYSSAALSWLRVALLLVVMACSPIFVFLGVVVWRARLRHCLSARVYMCGRVVGWLPRAARRLFACERAGFRRLCV